jgi:catechol 2,3-dioxygenase-like lactoylglutathione lyase family enzyme
MASFGNHLKMQLSPGVRERARAFYGDVLGCRTHPSPAADLDLFEFANGIFLGIYYDAAQALPEADLLKATWLEIKSDDVPALRRKLLDFGVRPVDYSDKTRFYFQAPGGQVFRLAPEDGASKTST